MHPAAWPPLTFRRCSTLYSPYALCSPYPPYLPPQDLTSVRDIMTQNIQDVLGRGEALDCAPGGG